MQGRRNLQLFRRQERRGVSSRLQREVRGGESVQKDLCWQAGVTFMKIGYSYVSGGERQAETVKTASER